MTTENKNIGSDFDDFIIEEGILEEVTEGSLLRNYIISAARLKTALIANKISHSNTARVADASCLSIELADLLDALLPDTEGK